MSATLDLVQQLIRLPSVTPKDAECQSTISEYLIDSGFKAEVMQFEDVTNLWLRRGSDTPLFVFAGHTDVVPTGPEENWESPPFSPTLRNNQLFGRGAADSRQARRVFRR